MSNTIFISLISIVIIIAISPLLYFRFKQSMNEYNNNKKKLQQLARSQLPLSQKQKVDIADRTWRAYNN